MSSLHFIASPGVGPDRPTRAFRTRLPLALLAALALAACGTVALEPPPADSPLLARIDARVGIVYASAARTAVLVNPLLRIDIGKESVTRFGQVFSSMFTQATELPDWPPWRESTAGLDGVIVLEQTDAELKLGDDTGRNPDVVRIAYRVCLYEPDGTEVRCWTPAAHGSHQRGIGECLDLRTCIVPETEVALREAIARFAVEAENDPALRAWSARVGRAGRTP